MKTKTLLLAGALRALVAVPVLGAAVVPVSAMAQSATPTAADLAKTIAAAIHSALLANPSEKTADCVALVNQAILDSAVTPAIASDALVLTRPIVVSNKELSPPIDACLTRSLQIAQTPPTIPGPGTGGNGGQFGPAPQSNGGGGGGNATYVPRG